MTCTICDGSGEIEVEVTVTGYGHDCGGDPAACAQRCPVPVPELGLELAPCPAGCEPRGEARGEATET